MAHSQSLFPIKIYRDFYPKTKDLKDNLFPKLRNVFLETEKNNNAFMRDGTLCSYETNSYLHLDFPDETKEVVDFVESMAKEYWKECSYHSELHPYVMQMWANETPNGGWIQGHLHGSMPFTAVLYVDATPEQGNLFLENPLDMILMSQPISPDVKYPMGQEIEVNTGDVIMFPGFLKHSVKPNTTNIPRLVLAFNFASKGKYWAGQWVKD